MVYIFNIYSSRININIFISKSNFEGEGSIIFLSSQSLILTFQLETDTILNTQNGFFQIGGTQNNYVTFENISITINENTDVNLGIGGLFQLNRISQVNVTNCTVKSLNSKTLKSQNGSIFYIYDVPNIFMSNLNASDIKINGQGGFAFLDGINITIKDSSFSDFYSQGSGGTLMIRYIYLNIINVQISNSYSELFGGAIYSQSNTPKTNIHNFTNLTINNSTALIGGGIIYNYQKEGQKQINFHNNKAILCGQNFFLPVSQIKFLSFGEYNEDLMDIQQNIPKNLKPDSDYYQQEIILDDIDINQVYYLTLELLMGDIIIKYSSNQKCQQDVIQELNENSIQKNLFLKTKHQNNKQIYSKLNKNQSSYFSQNIFNMIYQKKEFGFGYENILQYTYSNKSNLNNILISDTSFDNTEFYFLFKISDYFSDSTRIDFNILGNNYSLKLQKQINCKNGKIKIQSNGLEYCKYCKNFQFVIDQNQQKCLQCLPSQFKSCSGNFSQLNQGYYLHQQDDQSFQLNQQTIKKLLNQNTNSQIQIRENKQINIFECSFLPENCQGGSKYGDEQCYKSNVGPLCLECDRYKTRQINNNISYTRSNSFQCHECRSYNDNLIWSILIILFIFIAIFIFDLILFLSFRNYRKKKQKEQRISAGVHFKFLLFFLQIINVCSFYQSPDIFQFLYTFQVYVWNPISSSYTNFIECLLLQKFQNDFFSIPYLLLIIQATSPIIFIFIYILFRQFLIQLIFCLRYNQIQQGGNQSQQSSNQIQENRDLSQINTERIPLNNDESNCNQFENQSIDIKNIERLDQNSNNLVLQQSLFQQYITNKDFTKQLILCSFYNFSLQIIQVLISGASCATFNLIGSFSYIDLTIKCENPKIKQVTNYFIIPMLSIYTSIFPGYLISSLFFNNKNLKNEKILQKFGFLYNEYNKNYYFWEFLRFIIKVLISMSILLSIPNNNIIGFTVIAVLAIYLILLLIFKPFKIKKHTFIEVGLVLSGMYMISCYIFNYISLSNNYFSKENIYLKVILLIGNIQAFAVLGYLLFIFLQYLFLLKCYSWCKRRCKKESRKRHQMQSEQIDVETNNNLQLEKP